MTKRKPKARHKRSGRPAKTTTPRALVSAAQRLEALKLREAGYDYKQIGEWLTPPVSRSRACELVMAALAEIKAETAEAVEEVRAIELQRLDSMMIKPLEAANQGDTRAIEAVLKIMDRRAQIMGIDAPKKQEHSGPNGGPIPYQRVEIVVVDPNGSDVPDASVGRPVPSAGPV